MTAIASVAGAVVALVSAAVAVIQARASQRAADSAVESNRLERHRQEIDQTPKLTGDYDGPPGGHGQLLLTNEGPVPLHRLHLQVHSPPWEDQPPKVLFDTPAGRTDQRESPGLGVGSQGRYDLTPWDDDTSGRQEFAVTAYRDDQEWTVHVSCDIPGSPRIRILD